MTLLEEITERRKAFHKRIELRAANVANRQWPIDRFVPAAISYAAAPAVSKYRVDARYEAAWHNEICGTNHMTVFNGEIGRFRAIKRAVCESYSFREEILVSKRRMRELSQARQIAMYLGKHHTSLSYPHMGRLLGGRDHTTILHGVKRIAELRETDLALNARIELLELRLGLTKD